MFLTSYILLLSSLFSIAMNRHMDFRERFLERKRLRALKDQRITVLNNYVEQNTVIIDDITHRRKIKGKSSNKWKKVTAIEKDFRRLLAMNGMKYNYKRDMYWRTWRRIPLVNNATTQIVSYKCNNPIHVNTTECQSCGMWTIEDRPPPCPYEFFSVISDDKLCGVNYTQYKDVNSTCPSEIKFSDLTATCDNPIETQWRFTKMYGVTEKYNDVICKNKDMCEIFTLYEITPEHVIFRIINSTHNVIYSRVMKPQNRNYICIDDCGRFNPNTRKVVKSDKPLKLNLLAARKTKREDSFNEISDIVTKRSFFNEENSITTKSFLNEMFTGFSIEMNDIMNFTTGVKKRKGRLNEMNKSNTGREDFFNETNTVPSAKDADSTTEKASVEILQDNESLSNIGGKETILISIEENSLLKRPKGMKRPHRQGIGKKRAILKPTATPCQKLQRERDHQTYDDEIE